MLQVRVSGLSIAYDQRGDDPPLVLLHGFSHDSRVWKPQMEGLDHRFSIIACDAPGAGQSAHPPDTFGIGDWTNCINEFLDAIGVQKAHILGLSWGGLLAQEFYRHHAERVHSLILADTYAGWKGSLPEPIPQQRLEACLRDALLPPSEFVAQYLPDMFGKSPKPEVSSYLGTIMSDFHPRGFQLMAEALAIADTRDLLPNIHVPTLLIWGDADVRSPVEIAHQLHDNIPGAKLAVISGVGHMSNLEAPEQFNSEVLNFCRLITDP